MISHRVIRVGTRASALALAQAESVAGALRAAHPRREFVIVEVSTKGDRDAGASVSLIGGSGVFVGEIEAALRENRIDIAVHSLKDMPTGPTPGLVIAAIPKRDDPRDAFVSRDGATLHRLPTGARIGTGSSRRAAQLRALRPNIRVVGMRGNVDTRLRKVESGEYDAAVLAMAGLVRLGLAHRAAEVLPPEAMLPAPGQGALAVQARLDDADARALAAPLDDPPTRAAVVAERATLARLGGGCLLPMGVYGEPDAEHIRLRAVVAHESGSPLVREEIVGDARDPEAVGADLARKLIDAGARPIIESMGVTP